MAKINEQGNITARCLGCDGALSLYEFQQAGQGLGVVCKTLREWHGWQETTYPVQFRLFRCVGCGAGGFGVIRMDSSRYPEGIKELLDFRHEAPAPLTLPKGVPQGIVNEFREAERCLANHTHRAAAAMFRSVLDKTLRANGYKTKRERLQEQIDEAAADGVITSSRQKKAHEEIRVLGNDVLHDEWHPISEDDVEAAHHYTQRILEDFYDDREAVLKLLRSKQRVPEEDLPSAPALPTSESG
jgi:hypothetical protein